MVEKRVFGDAGRLVIRAKLFRSTIILVCAALVLASCGTYKARLTQRTEPRSGAVILPSPTEDWKLVEGEERVTGWVRLRFDVSATGQVRGVQTIDSSDERLSEKAAAMMASWSFEPGTIEGKPAKFEDIEFMMAFVEESTKSEIVLAVIIVGVIAVALAFALAEDIERDCEFLQC
ncbi:MAG: TonB family protein [Proteobacteria bacterium]|nr:TonB family protein [Pseudomonadota bacterium]